MERIIPLVVAHILPKDTLFKLPSNVKSYTTVRVEHHLPEEYKELADIIDFNESNVVITSIDNSRKQLVQERFFQSVLRITGITQEKIQGKRGKRAVVFARSLFWLGMKRTTDLSLEAIGKFTGDNDHSSVLVGIRRMEVTYEFGSYAEQVHMTNFLAEHKIKL